MERLITHPLNFYAILIESLSIIFSWKKIFTQITIATIFPLSFLSLCHAFFLSKETAFCLFTVAYVVFFLALSLVSTSAVVEAVARVYTAREVRFLEVMGVVPRVWKRVMITFVWSLMVVVVYNMAAFSLLFPWTRGSDWRVGPMVGVYVFGFVCISIIWHLASVVSVLEEDCGVVAMVKSMGLVKGRVVISGAVFLLLNLCFVSIQMVFQRFVVVGELLVWRRIGCGIVCFLMLCGLTLLGLVTQTVVYFVCKLYHSEILVPNYVNHPKVDLGDYASLRSNDSDHC